MDINELRKLLKKSTSILVMDNGEPALVVMDYATYKKEVLDQSVEQLSMPLAPSPEPAKPPVTDTRETELMERLNKEILALKHQIEIEEKKSAEWSE